VTRASQDWVGENVTVKTKSPTSEERWEGPGLINGGAAHLFRLGFWGEGNDPVTLGARPCHPFYSVHPLFFWARSARAERNVPPFLFGPPVHWSRPGPDRRPKMEILWIEDRTEMTRSGPVRSSSVLGPVRFWNE